MACVPVHEKRARVGTACRDVVGLTDLDPPWLGRDDLAARGTHAGVALLRRRRAVSKSGCACAPWPASSGSSTANSAGVASRWAMFRREGMAPMSFSSLRQPRGHGRRHHSLIPSAPVAYIEGGPAPALNGCRAEFPGNRWKFHYLRWKARRWRERLCRVLDGPGRGQGGRGPRIAG